ncbi:hypothetical protein CMEL01_07911 [Colletotrichum melonis]|uniref:Transmembrane protein n=1 Tax=Colletotrichum melonis TaxID=1209925 RepID=A0AAI9U2R3_9PEZI|nr:hypothetical protein CMEL01_07911 [Colletotrichum melonis]
MGRGLLWNVGVLVVVFRKQVGSYRSRRQGQSRRREEGRRADEKDQAECRAKGKRKKKRRGGPQRVVYDYEWGADEVSWVVGGFLGSLCLFFFFLRSIFPLPCHFVFGGRDMYGFLEEIVSRADYFSFAAP